MPTVMNILSTEDFSLYLILLYKIQNSQQGSFFSRGSEEINSYEILDKIHLLCDSLLNAFSSH